MNIHYEAQLTRKYGQTLLSGKPERDWSQTSLAPLFLMINS